MQKYTVNVLILLTAVFLLQVCTRGPDREPIQVGSTAKITFYSEQLLIGEIRYDWFFNSKPENSRSFLVIEGETVLFTPDVAGDYDILVSVIDESHREIDDGAFYYTASGGPAPAITEPQAVPDDTIQQTISEPDTITADQPKPEVMEVAALDTVFEVEDQPDETPAVQTKALNEPEDEIQPLVKENEQVKVIDHPEDTPLKDPLPHEIDPEILNADAFTIQVSAWKTLKVAAKEMDRINRQGFKSHVERYFNPKTDQVWYRVRLTKYPEYEDALTILTLVRDEVDKGAILVPLYNKE